MNVNTPKAVLAVELSWLLHDTPGLLDRGVMLGIGKRETIELIVGLADMLLNVGRWVEPDFMIRDGMLDAIGYVEEDHLALREPTHDAGEISVGYSEGCMRAAYLLRGILPEEPTELEYLTLRQSQTLYIAMVMGERS